MTCFGPAVDAALEACVVPGFSRIGLAIRSRLLPEYTADDHPGLDGRTILITGATSGIGYAAAVALARRGAAVHFLARDRGRAERAQRGIAAASGSTSISYGLADLEDLDAVRAFARQFCATHDRLDVLIHNAGAIHTEFRTDTAGTELTIVGQVVAPFLLTRMLMPALLAATPSRVIAVSSGGMYTQRLDPGTLQLPASRYRGVTAYARAKRAQVALSREWARRLAGTGVAFHAMHPGWADTPGVAAALPGFRQVMRPILLSPEQGADTIVWLATAPQARLGSGRFWHDRRARPEYPLPWTRETDPSTARKLWDHLAAATATDSPKAGAGRMESQCRADEVAFVGGDPLPLQGPDNQILADALKPAHILDKVFAQIGIRVAGEFLEEYGRVGRSIGIADVPDLQVTKLHDGPALGVGRIKIDGYLLAR